MIFKDIFLGLSRSGNFQEKNPGVSRRHGNPAKMCCTSITLF